MTRSADVTVAEVKAANVALGLDRVKRRIYLSVMAFAAPLIPVIAYLQWDQEVLVRYTYPTLTVVLLVLATGLWTRRIAVPHAEAVVLIALSTMWLSRLGFSLYAPGPLQASREVVTESVGPGMIVMVILIYLAADTRGGLLLSSTLAAAFAVLVVPRVIVELMSGRDTASALALTRQVVFLTAIVMLVYGLSVLKARVAEQQARAADLSLLAATDPLTGIGNRRRGVEALRDALLAAERYDRPLAVVLLDLDNFKQLNDRSGHAAGDEALRQVVSALQADLRGVDTLVRWGGDELLVIAPETDQASVLASADRWRLAVADLEIGEHALVTVSVGIAVRRQGDSVDTLIARADRAMYAAKGRGRNRVALAEADTEASEQMSG